MGNIAVTIKDRGVSGSLRYTVFDLQLSNSYATGGDSITTAVAKQLLSQEGNWQVADILQFISEVALDGTEFALDRTNLKVSAWNGRTQVAGATDLSGANSKSRCTVYFGEPNPITA